MATPITIEDLKKHLGPGLGLRKAKYMLEIPVPNEGRTINILCRSTSLPERNIGTVSVFNKGRKYNMRSETAYPGTYDVSVVDDSTMKLRTLFDCWLTLVDNSNPGGQSASSYESNCTFSLGTFGGSDHPDYQADVNIWQLGNQGEKVYGYKLQNAFPSSLGTVELDDSDEATLSEFSIAFTYSESIPLKPDVGTPQFVNTSNVVGKDSNTILKNTSTNIKDSSHNADVLGRSEAITSDDLAAIATGEGIASLLSKTVNNMLSNALPQVFTKPLNNKVTKKANSIVSSGVL